MAGADEAGGLGAEDAACGAGVVVVGGGEEDVLLLAVVIMIAIDCFNEQLSGDVSLVRRG